MERGPRTIERLAAYRRRHYTVSLPGEAARLDGASVTPSLFAMVGATPALGASLASVKAPRARTT